MTNHPPCPECGAECTKYRGRSEGYAGYACYACGAAQYGDSPLVQTDSCKVLQRDQRIAVLEAALRQYADHERWSSVRSNSQALCWWLGVNDADNRDGWAVAEEALKPGGKAVETKQEQPKPVEPPPLNPTEWQAIAQKLSVDLDRALQQLADAAPLRREMSVKP